ncbi:MAG: UrcA family protein [Proteobacteria bacterium]|nr:UrcA family protein [Pseudomonadota bacterium]
MTRCSALAALGILATAALLASPAIASAAQPSAREARTNVYYDQRDLSTERAIRSLYLRIVSAAQEVCPGPGSKYEDVAAASKLCQRRAIARAISQIGNGRLAALDAQIEPYRG